jgi:hypothetical protein
MNIKEHASSIAGLTLTTALASVATATLLRMLPRPHAPEGLMSVVHWINAPSAIPSVSHIQLIALGAAAAGVLGALAWRVLRPGVLVERS